MPVNKVCPYTLETRKDEKFVWSTVQGDPRKTDKEDIL